MNDTAMNGPPDGWRAELSRLQMRPGVTRGVYVHVPYCAARCGYCDFNTYTPREIDLAASDYAGIAIAEIELTGQLGGDERIDDERIDTVFLGGGTPTLLDPGDVKAIVSRIDSVWGLAGDAEITIEANPDSVTVESLARLWDAGVTRVSFGVQSLAEHVLTTLDRTHTPGRALEAIAAAQQVGFTHISVDLIYATPGETDEDLTSSARAVLDAGVDHLSAYSLIIEPGTRMAARVNRGELPAPDDDVAAHRYEIIDTLARDHGLEWYEVSNWAKPGGECQHNLGYWRGGDWWAIGPGAHGYLGGEPGVRWWNIKHPRAYAESVNAGRAPVAGWELIDEPTRILESVMLGLRLREGIDSTLLPAAADPVVQRYVGEGLLTVGQGRIRLTDAGRLLADACVRDLCGAMDGPVDPA